MNNTSVNYLPVNILNRYELFLVLNDKKPACTVTVNSDKFSYHTKLVNFLTNNDLFFTVDTEDKNLYFVSKSRDYADKLGIIWNNEDDESTKTKGELLGYPNEAVLAFVKYARDPERLNWLALCDDPYGGYILRKDHKNEDSEVSRGWRAFVEENNPVLVKWLDKKLKPHLVKR